MSSKASVKSLTNTKLKFKNRKRQRRNKWLGLSVGLVLLLSLSGLFYYLTVQKAKANKVKTPTIALVNEDKNQTFNGQNYQFGTNFVNLVSNDNNYQWKTLSRSVADRSYKDGSVDAVIYLPADFSQKLLTLEALSPEKAEVTYKIENTNQPELTRKEMDETINGLLYDLNTSVVKMYYSSIAGNVASAEINMGNVVGDQNTLLSSLSSQVVPPFQNATSGYDGIVKSADFLKNQNTSWVEQQNKFTDATTKLLTKINSGIETSKNDAEAFYKSFGDMMRVNSENANLALKLQNSQDTKYYNKFFEDLNTSAKNQVDKMAGTDSDILDSLSEKVTDYQDIINSVKADIDTQNAELVTHTQKLYDLEANLLSQFFNYPSDAAGNPITDAVPEDDTYQSLVTQFLSEANARTALANKLNETAGEGTLPSAYQNKINSLLSGLYLGDDAEEKLTSYLTVLQTMDSTVDIEDKADKIEFLRQYANVFGITGAGWQPATPEETTTPTPEQELPTVKRQMSVIVPANETATITATGATGITSVLDGTEGGANISIPAQAEDTTYEIEFTIPVSSADVTTITFTQDFETSTDISDTIIYAPGTIVEPASAIQNDLKNNFQNITNMLSDIDSAVSLIEFLYGAPDTSSGNLEKYTAFTSRSETTDFTDHSSESVYNKYDNIDFSEVKDRLSSADVHDFMAEGQRNLELLVGTIKIADDENHTVTITGQGQIQKILEVREDLQADSDTLNQNLPADYFADSLAQITNWYNETVTVLNTAYKAWLPNTANQLDLIDWPSVAPSTTTSFDASEDQSTSDEAAVEYYSYPDTVGEKLEMPENDPVAEEIRRLLEGRSTDNESGDEETDAPAETTPDTSTVDPDGLHLYTSQASLDELYQSFETLYSNSESVAKSTSASAEEIEDNAEEFDTLVKQTQTTGTEADNVLKETSKILQSGNLALEKSKDYYQNFQKTLANTRDEKADTNTIYDFFANPIKALNLSTAAKLIRSFDWRWIVVFVFGLVLGMTAMWMKKAPSAKLENGNSDMDVEDWE